MKQLYKAKLLILFILFSSLSVLNAASGKITGRVIDKQTGEAIPSANIVITHSILPNGTETPINSPLGAAADIEGYYFILNVPPGVYVVKASSIGYTSVIQRLVQVDLDRTINLNFELTPSAIEMNQIVITAEREIIKKDISGTQEVITTARIEQMPVLRVDEFVGKIKGVELVSGEQGNGLSIRGGSIRETDVRLDGISLQDPRSENSYLGFNSTSIQEVQVMTGGFQAKYGGIRSGLLNVVTKDGQREKYTFSVNGNMAYANQKRYFGSDPYGTDSWLYRVYLDTSASGYAWQGVPDGDTTVPVEFRDFKGWANKRTLSTLPLDSLQKYELWKAQHPQYEYGNKPDIFIEGTLAGPIPGDFIPIWEEFSKRSVFMWAFKYEDTQMAFPVGPRNNYVDWNSQLKITTQIADNMRLSVNGLLAKVKTTTGNMSGTSFGGALQDASSSFSFLNNSESSVNSQALLINGSNFDQLFNKSRLQYYDQEYFVSGAKLTHTLSNKAFYTLDFQLGYTDQTLTPYSYDGTDSSKMVRFYSAKKKQYYYFYLPDYGSPDASTNFANDALDMFRVYGGQQRVDSSYSYVYQLKGDLTAQIGRYHQVEAGFSAKLQDLFVYAGTWYQSQLAYTPDTWQYYKATPLELGLYAQDKLEFEGMILNLGLRLDIFDPMKKGYVVGFPSDEDYRKFYNNVYANLPGESQSYERWVAFRKLIDNPPGWSQTENKIQAYVSPRLGVSFPITETSKLYFNYGHFYQKPQIAFLYNTGIYPSSVTLPSPDLLMGRTVQYEFGYEQMFLDDFLFNVTAYYKDVSNEPLSRTYINYYADNNVVAYYPDAYSDIRGVELRLEKAVGKFVSFNAMYDYMLESYGQTGLSVVYEDRVIALDKELRSANVSTVEPRPRANVTLNLHTPEDFGPELFGVNWLGGFYANFFFEWQDGGRVLLNSEETQVSLMKYKERVNYWNIDFRGSKVFQTPYGNIELIVTIQNLTNNKWLNTGNMSTSQLSNYKNSLREDDKWGEYKSDDGHIDLGWYTTPLFLNPRRIILGARINL